MRKINFENYTVTVRSPDGELRDVPYDVKDSIVGLLFHADLKLSGMELLKQNELAGKILHSKDPEILFEEAEYNKIKQAINVVTGYGRNEVELVRRVLEAPAVEVEAKKALKQVKNG